MKAGWWQAGMGCVQYVLGYLDVSNADDGLKKVRRQPAHTELARAAEVGEFPKETSLATERDRHAASGESLSLPAISKTSL